MWTTGTQIEETTVDTKNFVIVFVICVAPTTEPDFDSARAASEQQRAVAKADAKRRATVADTARVSYEQNIMPTPYFTYLLIAISVAVAIFSKLGADVLAIHHLFIADIAGDGDLIGWTPHLADVRAGQVWRLVTPIFIHFNFLHIAFNMMMLKDLGTLIESRFGGRYLAALVLVSAVLSNIGQYFWSGPIFGGMSGIDYALFGFVWIRAKCDPRANWRINPSAVYQIIGWFVICLVGIIPYVANVCHGVGLVVGMAWGWLSAKRVFSR